MRDRQRLTRSQHVVLRLGKLIAWAEGAAALTRRAARAAEDGLDDRADRRFDAATLAAIGRAFARDAAQRVCVEGLGLVVGSDDEVDPAAVASAAGWMDVLRLQRGAIRDMDIIRDALYRG